MTGPGHADRVRALLDAWNRDDFGALGAFSAADVSFDPPPGWPESASAHSREEMLRQFAILKEPWESERVEIQSLEEHGARVLCHFSWHTRGRSSAIDAVYEMWAVCSFHGESITRLSIHWDRDAALEAMAESPARRMQDAAEE